MENNSNSNKIDKDQLKSNIQINYNIIRTTYDIINGYVTTHETPENDFYCLLDISKSSYDKLVLTGSGYNQIPRKAKIWSQLTGIQYGIFTGIAEFKIKDLDYQSDNNNIREIMKAALKVEITDSNLLALKRFCKYKNSAIDQETIKKRIAIITKAFKAIDLRQLSFLPEDDLGVYITDLNEHLEICKAVHLLKKYQDKSKKP